jgi:hypothetical protein
MTVIFISGSRQIISLPEGIPDRLDNIVNNGFKVVIGDSEKGVDRIILEDLRKRNYPNVSVFSIHSSSRIKSLSNAWDFQRVEPNIAKKLDKNGKIINGRELEAAKDRAMGDMCDYGLVIWQDTYTNQKYGNKSVSSGSLRNMVQLLMNNKPVALYHRLEHDSCYDTCFSSYELKNITDLEMIIQNLDNIVQNKYKRVFNDEVKLLDTIFPTEELFPCV